MYKEINNDCEFSCDEAVLRKSNDDERKFYALTLVNSLRLNKNHAIKQNLIMEFNNKDILKRRLASMVNLKIKKSGVLIGIVFALIVISSSIRVNNIIASEKITSTNTQTLQPNQVIENYFKYASAKDKEGILTTLTDKFKPLRINWISEETMANYTYFKISSIEENVKQEQEEVKYRNGLPINVESENLKVYKVNYSVKYKFDLTGLSDKKISTSFILTRKDTNSPWLIDDMGEG